MKFLEKIETHFMFNNIFRKFCKIMLKNTVESDRPHRTILSGACALHEQWLCKSASILRYN